MSYVRINDVGIARLFTDTRGPVARHVDLRADRILENARLNIARKIDSRTGDLAASLKRSPVFSTRGGRMMAVVGADAKHRGFNYARALETGINPDTGAPMKFSGEFSYLVPAVRQSGFRQRR